MSLNKAASKSRKGSQGPPQSMMMGQQNEATRLRQQLIHAKQQIKDLQEELQDQNQQYLEAIKERDAGAEKLKNAKDSIGRFDALVKAQVDRAMAGERREKSNIEKKLEKSEEDFEMLKQAKDSLEYKLRNVQDQLDDYKHISVSGDGKKMGEMRGQQAGIDRDKKDKEITKLTKHMNYLQDQIEDFMAENKLLRDMSAVPDNFGIDREKVRLMDREKIDDYKKLVRILQEDNYILEQERANLKHKIKEMSMLINNKNPVERYEQFNLRPDQWAQLDQFVLKLKNDEVIEPADIYDIKMNNEILKAQIEVYKDKDVDKVRGQMESVLKELTKEGPDGQKGLLGGGGISPEQLKQIMQGYEDIKNQLNKISEQGIAMGKQEDQFSQSFRMNQTGSVGGQTSVQIIPNHLQPPKPTPKPDGTIASGYSFRFDAIMPVTGRHGERDEKQEYDNAFLQLQLMECFAKIDKQDEIMRSQKRDVEVLYQRIQKYVLMQDHLYRDYSKLEKKNEELNKRAAQRAMEAEEELQTERQNVKNLETLVDQLQKQPNIDATKKQLIEFTKQNTILEVNMIQYTRKYQNLEEKEKLLRRNYEVVDLQMSEMQVECEERINELKKWKSNAVFQMKGLYERLKTSYPEAEYQSLEDELKLLRNKYADQINQIQDMTSQLLEFKKNQRLVNDKADQQKEIMEYNQDLEKQYTYLSSRLVRVDSKYRYQQQVIKRIVRKLRNANVSVVKAFQKFDTDKDGYISASEMAQALEDMGMDEMSNRDIQMLMDQMDQNKNQLIEYKEFSFMLQREGLKSRSLEESMVFNIIKTMKKLRKDKSYIFGLIDKRGQGYISKQDFKEFLDQLRSDHISDNDIESFVNYFFKDENGGDVTVNTFVSKFNMFERKMQEEENTEKTEKKRRKQIGESTLRRKKSFFDELQKAMTDVQGATLLVLFNKIDTDKSGDIDLNEFKQMFSKMGVKKFKDDEVFDIFLSMDIDKSERVEFAEFQADFNNIVSKTFQQLWEEELTNRQLYSEVEDQEMDGGFGISYSSGIGGAGMSEQLRADLERKISSLDSKLKISQMEINKEQELKDITNQTLVLTQKRYDDLLKQFTQSKEEIFNYEMQIKTLKDLLNNSISKEQSQTIQQENDKIKTKLRETKSEMLSYKNMHNTVCEQVKSLKLLIERRKDENESLHQSVREMASESIERSQLDKLRYVVMLSRWQEAAVNKKYSMKINELNLLRTQLIERDEEIISLEQEKDKHNIDIQQYAEQSQNLRKQLSRAKILFLPLSKAESFEHDIKKLVHERDQIDIKYLDLRSQYNQVKLVRDNLQVQADTWREYKNKLENASKPQLNSEISKMIDKIQEMRIKTLQAESKSVEMTEKNQHLEKLLDLKKKEITQLNEECAKIEKTMAVREQNWRERDSERIKKFFAAKLKEEDQQRAIAAQRRGYHAQPMQGMASQPLPTYSGDDSSIKPPVETFKDAEITRLQEACAKLQLQRAKYQNIWILVVVNEVKH